MSSSEAVAKICFPLYLSFWGAAHILTHSGWSGQTVPCHHIRKDGVSLRGHAWRQAQWRRQSPVDDLTCKWWERKGMGQNSHWLEAWHPKKKLYCSGYRKKALCQPSLLARMKHSKLSWWILYCEASNIPSVHHVTDTLEIHGGDGSPQAVKSCQSVAN